MKHSFFIILTVIIIFFTGCDMSEKDKETSKEIVSYDYKYKIDVPGDWEVPEKKNELCTDSSIEAFCRSRVEGLIVIVEPAGEDYIQFDNFCTLVARNINSQYYTDVSMDDFKDAEICGNKAKYVEINDVSSPSGEDHVEHVHMWYYLVNINGYYTQFCVWTPEDKSEQNKDELNMIINSFTIFKIKNNN